MQLLVYTYTDNISCSTSGREGDMYRESVCGDQCEVDELTEAVAHC